MDNRKMYNYTILYLCDRKCDCNKSFLCINNGGECNRTIFEQHALHGPCSGRPDWYPERFVESSHDVQGGVLYYEKETF